MASNIPDPSKRTEELHDLLAKINNEAEKLLSYINDIKLKGVKAVARAEAVITPSVAEEVTSRTRKYLTVLAYQLVDINCEIELAEDESLDFTIPYPPVGQHRIQLQFLVGDSPWNFWLFDRTVDTDGLYRNLMKKYRQGLLESCSKPKPSESICFFYRNKIFRGIVLQNINENRVKVLDCDSHRINIVDCDNVFQPDPDACAVHASALRCTIEMKEPNDSKLWDTDLKGIFSNALTEAILQVRILEKLPGSFPSFLVDVEMHYEEEKGNLKEWLMGRLLPEVKKLNSNETDSVWEFISAESLDPYYKSCVVQEVTVPRSEEVDREDSVSTVSEVEPLGDSNINDLNSETNQVSTNIPPSESTVLEVEPLGDSNINDLNSETNQVSTNIPPSESTVSEVEPLGDSNINDLNSETNQVSTNIPPSESTVLEVEPLGDSNINDLNSETNQVSTNIPPSESSVLEVESLKDSNINDLNSETNQVSTNIPPNIIDSEEDRSINPETSIIVPSSSENSARPISPVAAYPPQPIYPQQSAAVFSPPIRPTPYYSMYGRPQHHAPIWHQPPNSQQWPPLVRQQSAAYPPQPFYPQHRFPPHPQQSAAVFPAPIRPMSWMHGQPQHVPSWHQPPNSLLNQVPRQLAIWSSGNDQYSNSRGKEPEENVKIENKNLNVLSPAFVPRENRDKNCTEQQKTSAYYNNGLLAIPYPMYGQPQHCPPSWHLPPNCVSDHLTRALQGALDQALRPWSSGNEQYSNSIKDGPEKNVKIENINLSVSSPAFVPRENRDRNCTEQQKTSDPVQCLPATPDAEDHHHIELEKPRSPGNPGDDLVVMLSHVESPSKFYVHLVTAENIRMDRLRDEMFQYYNSTDRVTYNSWEEAKYFLGKFCACKWSEDNYWYRVEVVDWELGNNQVEVFFVDDGNKDCVSLSDLQPLHQNFCKLPMFAQRCHLAEVYPVIKDEPWSRDSIEFFKSKVDNGYTHASLVTVVCSSDDTPGDSLSVLFYEDQDIKNLSINDQMVARGLAWSKRQLTEPPESGVKFLSHPESIKESDESRLLRTLSRVCNRLNAGDENWEWDPREEDYHSARNNPALDFDDACVAVSGYSAKDEQRVCKFFAQTGYCWKANCRKEHFTLNKDAVTTDKEEVYDRAFSQIILPNWGEEVDVRVTAVDSLSCFYIQLRENEAMNSNADMEEDEETLTSLHEFMNLPENVERMRYLAVPPALSQLVLAKFEEQWFRARVISVDDNPEVMFVDYGSVATINEIDLREMEPRYLHLPFQAIECSLANIIPTDNSELYKKGVEQLRELIFGNILTAKIYDCISSETLHRMEILLHNSKRDIGEILVERGFASKHPVNWPPRRIKCHPA